MTKVTIYGELAVILGKSEWQFELTHPAEVFAALEANTDKLLKHMFANPESEYQLLIDEAPMLVLDELYATRPMQHLKILPILAGSSSGGLLAIIGMVIIAAVVIWASAGTATPGVIAVFTTISGTAFASFALTLGVMLVLSGVSQMLLKSPTNGDSQRPENKPSYLFNGAVNSYRQGNPISIGFGKARVGSQVISAGLRSVDILAPVV